MSVEVNINELVEGLKKSYNNRMITDPQVQAFAAKVANKTARYEDCYLYATSSGETIADVLIKDLLKISPTIDLDPEALRRIITKALEIDHDSICGAIESVQKIKYENMGLGINPTVPAFDASRVNNIYDSFFEIELQYANPLMAADPAVIQSILKDVAALIENNSLHTVDEGVKKNADFASKVGLGARIIRKAEPGCCEWCSNLDGVYEYPEETLGTDVFKRHKYCRCTTTYVCGKEIQDVWAKKRKIDWSEIREEY